MFDFRRIRLFCLGYRLSKHEVTICSENAGEAPCLRPYRERDARCLSCSKIFHQRIDRLYCLQLLASEIFSSEQRRHAGLWSSVETFLHYIFAAFWVMPLYLISKAVSSVWFLDVADSVYKLLYGRPRAFRSLSIGVADLLYGAALQFIFLQQTYAVRLIPLEGVGSLLYCVHMCLLNALYAFEYKWCNMGMELKVRLYLVDQYWPYFCGFGLPLFLVTNVAFSHYPMVVGACVFSILFPFYIISGTQASVPKQKAPFRLYIFEPSASFCSYVFSFRSRRGA